MQRLYSGLRQMIDGHQNLTEISHGAQKAGFVSLGPRDGEGQADAPDDELMNRTHAILA